MSKDEIKGTVAKGFKKPGSVLDLPKFIRKIIYEESKQLFEQFDAAEVEIETNEEGEIMCPYTKSTNIPITYMLIDKNVLLASLFILEEGLDEWSDVMQFNVHREKLEELIEDWNDGTVEDDVTIIHDPYGPDGGC